MRGVVVIIIGITLLVAGFGIWGYNESTRIDAKALCDDWEIVTGTFDSYDPGDEITIIDEINDIKFVPNHITTGEPVDWTMITLKSVDLNIDELSMMMYQPSKLWGFIIFKGDITQDYKIGDVVEIQVKVISIEFMGQTIEVLEWYSGLLDVAMEPNSDIESISYGDLAVADKSDISHYQYLSEVISVLSIIIGLIIISIASRNELKRRKEKLAQLPVFLPITKEQFGNRVNSIELLKSIPMITKDSNVNAQKPNIPHYEPINIKYHRSFKCTTCGNEMPINFYDSSLNRKIFCDNCGKQLIFDSKLK